MKLRVTKVTIECNDGSRLIWEGKDLRWLYLQLAQPAEGQSANPSYDPEPTRIETPVSSSRCASRAGEDAD